MVKLSDSTEKRLSKFPTRPSVSLQPWDVYLSSPFLKDVVELPSLETLPNVLGVIRDPITNEISHYKVRLSHDFAFWGGQFDPSLLVKPEDMVYHLSNLALNRGNPRGCDSVVMAFQGDDYRRLACCPISRQFTEESEFDGIACRSDPNRWTGLQEDYAHLPDVAWNQVVYDTCRNLFYTMFEETSGILAFDVLSDRGHKSKMVFNIPKYTFDNCLKRAFEEKDNIDDGLKELRNRCKRRFYLVTLENGDLLLIVRHYEIPLPKGFVPHKTLHMDVFRIVYPGTLEPVTCLHNDRAIFIGWNQSFCIIASSSPGIRPNCIYFTDDVGGGKDYNVHTRDQWGHDTGIFSMEDGSITPFYPYEDEQEEKKVPLSVPLFWVAPLSSDIEYLARQHGL